MNPFISTESISPPLMTGECPLFQVSLHHNAVKEGYGYKAANLLALKEKVAGCVKIPSFLPISNGTMSDELRLAIPNLVEMWEYFKDSFDCESNKITPLGKKILLDIQIAIREYFASNQNLQPQIQKWLDEEKPEFLIVRSTGKEDSDTCSNAGGNVSAPFVKPHSSEIKKAIGEVIASYFSEKSILQRLQAEDPSLSDESPPFIPVLLQTMVVEDHDIPRSGVMFTSQGGVTLIQAGLGNNEGIVSSQVGVDSYFVKDNIVHKVIREKKTRFVSVLNPDGSYKAAPIGNKDPSLINQQALPNSVVRELNKVGKALTHLYSKPLDIEFTVKGSVIHLLQMRPLLEKKGEKSYLDRESIQKAKEKIPVNVLLDGGPYVREIPNPESILFADNLSEGFNHYLNAEAPIQVIVSRKTAPSTSHQAVILRSKGVAVLVLEDSESLEKMALAATEDKPLLVDVQRGITLIGDKSHVRKGLISYPIPLEMTLPPSLILSVPPQHLPVIVKSWMEHADTMIKKLQNGKPFKKDNVRDLLDIMAAGSSEEAKLALASILKLIKDVTIKTQSKMALHVFEAALRHAKNELIQVLNRYPPESPERLYPLKFFDAMLFQRGSDSIAEAIQFEHNKNKIGSELTAILKMVGKQYAFNEETAANWEKFVSGITSQEDQRILFSLYKKMQEIHLAPLWVNIIFSEIYKNTGGSVPNIIHDLQETEQKNGNIIDLSSEMENQLNGLENQIPLFADPKFAMENSGKLKEKLQNDLGFCDKNGNFKRSYLNSDKLGKLVFLKNMHRAINIYDHVIKSLKGSRQFPNDDEKLAAFASLLEGYFTMMEVALSLLDKKTIGTESLKGESGATTISVDSYCKYLREGHWYGFGLNDYFHQGFDYLVERANNFGLNATKQLNSRECFRVDALIVGSRADLNFSAHWPSTLEDYFTTFHQNMERVIKILNTQNGMTEGILSKNCRTLCQTIQDKFEQEISYVTQEEGIIQVGYSIPLRQHSANLLLEYDPKKPKRGIDLTVEMFGNEEEGRWKEAASLGAILGATLAKGIHSAPSINYKNPVGVKFTLHLSDNHAHFEQLVKILEDFLRNWSMGFTNDVSFLSWIENYKIEPDWNSINFEHTLILNSSFFAKFNQEKNPFLAAKVAIQNLLGNVKYNTNLYSQIRNAVGAILKSMNNPQIQKLVQQLITHPKIKKDYPAMVLELNEALMYSLETAQGDCS